MRLIYLTRKWPSDSPDGRKTLAINVDQIGAIFREIDSGETIVFVGNKEFVVEESWNDVVGVCS